jgi:hypothetical protein
MSNAAGVYLYIFQVLWCRKSMSVECDFNTPFRRTRPGEWRFSILHLDSMKISGHSLVASAETISARYILQQPVFMEHLVFTDFRFHEDLHDEAIVLTLKLKCPGINC